MYAQELGQHPPQPDRRLYDALDGGNVYLVAARGPVRIGFISLTPPWLGRYGLDKYLTRDELPLLSEGESSRYASSPWSRAGAVPRWHRF